MFGRAKKYDVDDVMDKITEEMSGYSADSPEFSKMADNLRTVSEAKAKSKFGKTEYVKLGVMAAVGLLEIFMIIRHEDINVITTKALGFVTKPRL